MQKGIRFRIYPNKEQKNLITQTFGCCRLAYNKGLDMRKSAYAEGRKAGYVQTCAMLTTLKKTDGFAFLKDVDSVALQQSLRDLDRAYQNFFEKRAQYPHFKSKHGSCQSYRTLNQKDSIRIVGRYIRLPKLGFVKIRQSMEAGHIRNVTVERTPTGKYYAVLCVDFEPDQRPNKGGTVSIDVGIKRFYTDSYGNIAPNPGYLEKSMRKLAREQRRLSRKQNGSKNRSKQRARVALVHEKIVNKRNDFLQKQSTILVHENQTICIEDLNIRGMVRNHRLALHIASAAWGKFFSMLTHKASWYGNDIRKIPRNYASSQTCSSCGYKNALVKNLAVRVWECPMCHAVHDRDENASINILKKGLAMQAV